MARLDVSTPAPSPLSYRTHPFSYPNYPRLEILYKPRGDSTMRYSNPPLPTVILSFQTKDEKQVTYLITEQIGHGAFGAVYKVYRNPILLIYRIFLSQGLCQEDSLVMAIKCEPYDCRKRVRSFLLLQYSYRNLPLSQMLQTEFSVMRAGRCSGSPYFTEYGERGQKPQRYYFFTMQLVLP